MKKSTMLATAAFAVLLGLFVPCTSHATEIKRHRPNNSAMGQGYKKRVYKF